MTHPSSVRERDAVTAPPPPTRGWVVVARAVWSWWPVVLSALLGLVLAGQARGVLDLPVALETLVRMAFVTSVAGAILASFLRFVIWWFWTRRQP